MVGMGVRSGSGGELVGVDMRFGRWGALIGETRLRMGCALVATVVRLARGDAAFAVDARLMRWLAVSDEVLLHSLAMPFRMAA